MNDNNCVHTKRKKLEHNKCKQCYYDELLRMMKEDKTKW